MSIEIPDDADWINPIMVRYFRKNLRSRWFLLGFMGCLLGVVFVVIAAVYASLDSQHAANRIADFFQVLTVLPMWTLPLLAFGAFRAEVKDNTLELLLITRLRTRRIAWGAWQTFFALALLWQAILAPVWVLFYFTHGANFFESLVFVSSSLSIIAPFVMCGLWLGLLTSWAKIIAAGVFWTFGYFFTLAFATMAVSAISIGPNGMWPMIAASAHSLIATWLTRNLLSDSLIWRTHENQYYTIDAH